MHFQPAVQTSEYVLKHGFAPQTLSLLRESVVWKHCPPQRPQAKALLLPQGVTGSTTPVFDSKCLLSILDEHDEDSIEYLQPPR